VNVRNLAMRALVVTNMYPSRERPALGGFVRDQVEALRRIDDLDVELFAFHPGGPAAYVRAARDLKRRFKGQRFDVVHAHFGLTAWPALAVRAGKRVVTLHGNDVYHPRSRKITLPVLRRMDLVGVPTPAFAAKVAGDRQVAIGRPAEVGRPAGEGRAGKRPRGRTIAILPCGIDIDRFRPLDRRAARRQLGLDLDGRYLLFPYDPARAVKRADLARELAAASEGVELLTLGNIPTHEVALWMNAANAVVCPADWETFGLACIEALACDVPVLARPTGEHADALRGVAGTLCAAWDLERWRAALAPHLDTADPRVAGRARALRYSADALAARVATAWRWLVSGGPPPPLYSPAEARTEPSLGAPPS
jgi:glycosyltransferase involved in cell wall biosynthesis